MKVDEHRTSVSASAPGKVIICGEHYVVHGSHAVAAAINKRAKVKVSTADGRSSTISSRGVNVSLDSPDRSFYSIKSIAKKIFSEHGKPRAGVKIAIDSDIPAGSGLGSSAAVSVATAAALIGFVGARVEPAKIVEAATCGEKEVHGNPSGIDIQASLNGGMILFNKNSGAKPVPLDRSLQFLVVYSGRQRKTSELVDKVRRMRDRYPRFFERLTEASSFLSLEVVEAVSSGDLPYLGAIMNMMQSSLSWIGVSNRMLDNLIEDVLSEDVYGAKITGAGGGGSIIALPKPEKGSAVLKRIALRNKVSFLCTIPQRGLRMEEA